LIFDQQLGIPDGMEDKLVPTRRIFVTMPADFALNQRQNDLKWAIVREIEGLGYEAQVFGGPTGGWGLAAGTSWSLAEVDRLMRRCSGAVLIGLPKWRVPIEQREIWSTIEYCHYINNTRTVCQFWP
jgi:hypothetical protein